MKTLYLPIACLLIITGFVSCNSSDAEENTETSTPITASPANAADTLKQAPLTNNAPVTTAMNPAHGQPGHRCDIAVGAPLNSASSVPVGPAQIQQPGQSTPLMQVKSQSAPSTPVMQVNAQTVQSAPIIQSKAQPSNTTPKSPVVTTQNSAVAAGMNPVHGQPGHRCDIAVGAPLNSAAKSATTIVQPQAAPQQSAPLQVVPNLSAKLNPAHGQPGHDCAIPVGQPLKNQ